MSRKNTPAKSPASRSDKPGEGQVNRPNKLARLAVPLVAALIAVAFALSFIANDPDAPPIPDDSGTDTAVQAAPDAPDAPTKAPAAAVPAPTISPEPASTEQPPAQASAAEVAESSAGTETESQTTLPVEVDAPTGGYTLAEAENPASTTIGSDAADSDYLLNVELARYGAGVAKITLNRYYSDYHRTAPLVVAERLPVAGPGLPDQTLPAFTARTLTINGEILRLDHRAWDLVQANQASATYRLTVLAAETGEPVAQIERTYRLHPDRYDVDLDQRVHNLTQAPLQIQFNTYAQGDLLTDKGAYLGDRRNIVMGYFNPIGDPGKFKVHTEDTYLDRQNIVKDFAPSLANRSSSKQSVWPNWKLSEKLRPQAELVWLASTNRYFAWLVHAPVDESVTLAAEVPALQSRFPHVETYVFPSKEQVEKLDIKERSVLFALRTNTITIEPNQATDLSLGFYTGPREKDRLAKGPNAAMGFPELIRYNLGGPCAVCTFQWLAKGLLGFLAFLHDHVVFDWGVAIVLLVVTVRLILHPITKKAQANMMKLGKQMQSIQPELNKLKEKYKDDQSTLNKEMMKLYREKGINPAGALGCLPMFLQMPIWFALYAMLYFAIELRQESAFYGLFQKVTGGGWDFLADLSVSDRFIPFFEEARYFNLIFINIDYSALNILPILMGVTFYFNMKFTSPPPANDQQAQQQKIMKFMTLLFPFFLYSAPSGLTLYIMTSTAAGILDSYLVRRHIKKQEEEGTLFDKKPVKPGSLRDRLGKAFEAQQARMADLQAEREKAMKSGGKSGKNSGKPSPPSPDAGGMGNREMRRKRK